MMERLRIQEGAVLYYLTFSVIQWLPVFVDEEPCLIFAESLNYCHREKHLRTTEFVIMPTHIHLIMMDADFDLLYSALMEEQRAKGKTILCQLNLSERYMSDPVATLFTNRLIRYALGKSEGPSGKAAQGHRCDREDAAP